MIRHQAGGPANDKMQLSPIHDQAIAARMALIVGGPTFDRLFAGVRFDEVVMDILFVYAKDEETASEIEESFAVHIAIIATDILKREIGMVLVLPKQLIQQAPHAILMHGDEGPLGAGMDYKGLRALLVVHGCITLAAGVVLTVAPSLIPSVVGIHLEPSAYLFAYLLAGAEFGFAVLSFGGIRVADAHALRLVVLACMVFHASSGVLEVYAYARGASVAILGNVAARAVIVGAFAYLSTVKK